MNADDILKELAQLGPEDLRRLAANLEATHEGAPVASTPAPVASTPPTAPAPAPFNLGRFAAVVRQVGSVAAMVVGAIPSMPIPTGARAALIGAGGLVLAIEHYLAGS